MPEIPLNDVLGLDADGSVGQGTKLKTLLPRLVHSKDTPLDRVPAADASSDLVFGGPFDVGAGGLTLTAGASGGGTFALIEPADSPKVRVLDPDDPFHTIQVDANEIYVALGLDVSSNAGLSVDAGMGTFGLSASAGFTVKCYRRFERAGRDYPTLGFAFAETARSFLLPHSLAELDKLRAGTILTIAGEGELVVNGGFTLAMPVQALASTAAITGQQLEVNASASFSTKASLTISGGYQIRLRRLPVSGHIEIGIYTLKSREAALAVSARIGVEASVAGFDLAEKFIGALSRQPTLDVKEFRQALPAGDNEAQEAREEQIEAFQAALDKAISTKIEAGVSAAFSALNSSEAAWLFEIDPAAATPPEAIAAVASALHGDFRALTGEPSTLPTGITQTVNILTDTNVQKRTLNVNLLGVLNVLSLAKITRASTIEKDAQGDITLITDTSSASRLEAVLLNAAGNTKRLRQMLSETFLIEAVYRASDVGVLPPEYRSKHTYIEIHDHTDRQGMKDNLDAARVLGLISPDEENRRLGQNKNFGRTTFYLQAKYSNADVRRVFLDAAGNPRAVEEYEDLGRSALGALLMDDEGQEFRKRIAGLDMRTTAVWAALKKIGNVNEFAPVFGVTLGSLDTRVEAVGSDYIAITSWALAMHRAGQVIQEVDNLLGTAGVEATDAKLTEARAHLKKRIADVVSVSHDHFGDPLGFLMVYLAAGPNVSKQVISTGSDIETLEVEMPAAQTSGAAG